MRDRRVFFWMKKPCISGAAVEDGLTDRVRKCENTGTLSRGFAACSAGAAEVCCMQ